MRDAYFPKAGGSPLPDIFGEGDVVEKFQGYLKDSCSKPPCDDFKTEGNFQLPWIRCTGKLVEGALRKYGWNPTEKDDNDEVKKLETSCESTSEVEEDPAPCSQPLAAAWIITKPLRPRRGAASM